MKEKKRSPGLPVWSALGGLLLVGAGELALWLVSGYAPLLALALLQLMPAALNLLLLLPLGKQHPLPEAYAPEEGKRKQILKAMGRGFRRLLVRWANFWHSKRDALVGVLLLGAVFGANCLFWPNVKALSDPSALAYWMPVVLAGMFVVSVALEKVCAHAAAEESAGSRFGAVAANLRSAMALGRAAQVLTAAAMVLTLVGLYDPHLILQIVLLVLFLYETVLLVMSIAIRLIRRELGTAPALPLSVKAMGAQGLLSYLEENTGITMRSLWSIQLIRQLLPGVLLFVVGLTWLGTGVVQIEAHQEGALYRLGRLQEETLQPGLHLTRPWPFDEVEVYDTQSLRTVVVGYEPNGTEDNTWTDGHGTEEYRLLLGGGNEMVSINLQVEYRISDLTSYIRASADAQSLLSAAAYEIVTARTISTDIDSLLSEDRTVFSETFQQELSKRMEDYNIGIEVTEVVLESIHPPVEVAGIYQDVISAGIRAEQLVLEAQREAVLVLEDAQLKANSDTSIATTTQHQEIAAAEGAVAEFMAAVEAYNGYPSAYTYYKYMESLTKAYTKGVLILVGDGVDEGCLVIGDLQRPVAEDPYYVEEEAEEEYWEE